MKKTTLTKFILGTLAAGIISFAGYRATIPPQEVRQFSSLNSNPKYMSVQKKLYKEAQKRMQRSDEKTLEKIMQVYSCPIEDAIQFTDAQRKVYELLFEYRKAKKLKADNIITLSLVFKKQMQTEYDFAQSLENLSEISSKLEKKDSREFYKNLEQKIK